MTAGQLLLIKVLTATVISAVCTRLLIPELKKLKAGQSIREDGPQGHLAKAGTPTMGGLAMIFATAVVTIIFEFRNADAWIMIAVTLAFGGIGFIDDFIKVVKKNNLGLKAWQKAGLQLVISLLIAWYRSTVSTAVWIPFINRTVDFPQGWYIAFITFMVLAMTNSVNLTDGLDGLCSSVTCVVAAALAYICILAGARGSATLMAALAGACIGFLFFNANPAKVFMGDTGSLALGGALAAAAIFSDLSLLLPVMGIIYVAEALSVIIQVVVFQTCHGKRFFRMAPLHHHFELGGWSEKKVVKVFSSITGIVCIIAMFLYQMSMGV